MVLGGCSAKSDTSEEAPAQEAYDTSASEMTAEGKGLETYPADRKIIINADVTLRVSNFEKATAAIETAVNTAKGYVSESSLSESYAYMTVKIPAGQAKGFVTALNGFGTVIDTHFSSQDVTDHFTDLEIRTKNLQVQIDTLRSLLLKEGIQVEDIFKIENEIRRLVTELEGYKGQLRSLDARVTYSDIRINFVKETALNAPNPDDFGYELKLAFQKGAGMLFDFLQGVVLILAFMIPLLPLIILGLALAYWGYKKQHKNKS